MGKEMKPWKKTGIGILLVVFIFIAWYIESGLESPEFQDMSMAVSQSLSGFADKELLNWNSDKTKFLAFNNCYILSSKSP